jgi:hypothetical protein
LLGHFHNYMFVSDSVMVNGSLIGYNQFAMRNNFKYSKPEQALFLTHETRGLIYPMTVHLDDPKKSEAGDWVAWSAA